MADIAPGTQKSVLWVANKTFGPTIACSAKFVCLRQVEIRFKVVVITLLTYDVTFFLIFTFLFSSVDIPGIEAFIDSKAEGTPQSL